MLFCLFCGSTCKVAIFETLKIFSATVIACEQAATVEKIGRAKQADERQKQNSARGQQAKRAR